MKHPYRTILATGTLVALVLSPALSAATPQTAMNHGAGSAGQLLLASGGETPPAAGATGSAGATELDRIEDRTRRAEERARRQALSDEEREARRAEGRARGQQLTDEEREARRAESRARWEKLSEDERRQYREERAGKRGEARLSPEEREARRAEPRRQRQEDPGTPGS